MEVLIIFPLIIGLVGIVVLIRLALGSLDEDRVRQYIQSQGGRLLEKRWNPFGKGWFGSEHERIYEIRYIDSEENEHLATCKTSMFAGVYITEDRIVRSAGDSHAPESLAEENRRLREELARLKGK